VGVPSAFKHLWLSLFQPISTFLQHKTPKVSENQEQVSLMYNIGGLSWG
jgi:hypothetical protein